MGSAGALAHRRLRVNRTEHPAPTDIAVDLGGMRVSDVCPERVPDLVVGRPVILTGRFSGTGEATVAVTGTAAGERVNQTPKVRLNRPDEAPRPPGSRPPP